MYQVSKDRRSEVILWCYGPTPQQEQARGNKRQSISEGNTARKASRYDKHIDRMADVELIEDKLWEKHAENFTKQQLHSWAHLIQMKKHQSYDEPPDKPFFSLKS